MRKKLLAAPYTVWSVAFILIPLAMVFYYGLTDETGAFTLENIAAIATAEHSKALWLSLLLSLISTIICFFLAYPLAMILCRMQVNQHKFIVFIFILPMWMNFLLRTLAWQTLLEKSGVIREYFSRYEQKEMKERLAAIVKSPEGILVKEMLDYVNSMLDMIAVFIAVST